MGPPWDVFGSRPRKTTKRQLSGLPFWGKFLTYFLTFLMLSFCVFETSLLQVFGAKGTRRPQFRRALGAIWNTISTNMEKLKLRFRVGRDAKIKFWRCCVSPCFVIFMCRFPGRFFFMIRLTICHNFTHLCIHWKPIFDKLLQLFRPSFSST